MPTENRFYKVTKEEEKVAEEDTEETYDSPSENTETFDETPKSKEDESTENNMPISSKYVDWREMIKNEVEFSNTLSEINQKYPWYEKLPINNDRYIILWSIEEEEFRILCKISETAPENEKGVMIEEARKIVEEISGENIENFKYEVFFYD
jgi:hypothetical protein